MSYIGEGVAKERIGMRGQVEKLRRIGGFVVYVYDDCRRNITKKKLSEGVT